MNFGGSTDNTYTGTTWITSSNGLMLFKSGGAKAISGPLVVGTNIDPPYSAYLSLSAPNQIADNAPITVNASGILMLNGFNETIGDFSGNGYASLGTGVFTVGGANATNVFSGIITSSAGGEFDKISTNILILTGSNPYTGNTLVKNGTLLVNGYQSGSACYISPGAILGGIGTVGDILDLGGTVSPGHNGPGQLNCGHATFSSGSTFQVELQGTNAGVNYDQLNATGVITINAGVNLSVTNSFGGAVSNQFVVLKNDLTDAIIGTFNGLTNGANFSANGNTFRLNYTGNTGNDLVLTQLSSGVNAPQFGSLARLGNGGIQFNAVGTANQTYTVQANTNLATATWQTLGLTTANNLGALTYTDLQATNFATRCYRLSYP